MSHVVRLRRGSPPSWAQRLCLTAATVLAVIGPITADSLAADVSSEPTARLADGSLIPAKLRTVNARWDLGFEVLRREVWQPEQIAASGLVRWGHLAEITVPQRAVPHLMHAPAVLLVLNDDSLLSGYILGLANDRVLFDSDLLGEIGVPMTQVRIIVFRAAQQAARRDAQIAGWLSPDAEAKGDRLILANGDQLSGTLTALELQRDEDPKQRLLWKAELGQVEIALDQVAAVVLNPALVAKPRSTGPSAWVGFADGSFLQVSEMVLAGTTAQFRRAGGLKCSARARDVVFLQPVGSGIRYLSDMVVGDYRHLPFLAIAWPYLRDSNVLGTSLRSGGGVWLKGLGMHSAARISFALDRPYRFLAGELAIDDAAEKRGSVRFRVFVDGKAAYASPIVRGGEPPVAMKVELDGAKRIDLVIDFAEQGDVCDYADWLDLRLVP